MSINIQRNQKKRVVIVGGGLGGLRLAEDLYGSGMQVVLIDKNNFHQFPPLIYQIASAGIDPSSISFPFRQIFRKRKDFYFRMAEARMVDTEKKILQTSIGKIDYDYLVLAAGATTNFFGNKNIEEWAIPMKTVPEAMGLRNALLSNFERALTCATEEERQELLNVVIVGGGDTALQDALFLANTCRSVTLIHRRDAFRASAQLVRRAQAQENIRILRSCTVQKLLLSDDSLQGAELFNGKTGETERIYVEGLFVAVGQMPQSAPFEDAVATENGYYLAGEDTKTSLPGIFAAGDGRKKQVRQLTTAVSDGAAAALAACHYLEEQGKSE